ncbi:hypothetical protein OKA05_07945 [Luteolibacter arcticus]|uniref:Type II toxin-antitoxin system Phd/YefM family antitoxin n=1 Tax=Luteolibacter arcticus TaxID=1581411 RepID=A0ABT3GGC4_9BACT|nr:hypothetical protein [Luteolibacter arcticus]MCW1922483.1 hypothetical protein [Luteolibacter arcticus]
MILTIEQFQKDAKPWLAKVKETGETLVLLSGAEAYEVRPAGPGTAEQSVRIFEGELPKRSIIVGDPEDLVHIDWSSEWRP